MMRVALEIGLNAEFKRGADAYFEGLLRGLSEAGTPHRYTVFTYFFRDYARKLSALPPLPGPNFELRVPRWPERWVRALESAGVPVVDRLFARPGGYQLYHGLGGSLPRLSRARTVVTIYDLLYEVAHQRSLEEGRGAQAPPSGSTGRAALRADRVITISRCTAEDLVRFYRIDRAKITAIHLGVDHAVFSPLEPGPLREAQRRYGLPARYWLFMGPFEPRRNAEGALRALAALRREGLGGDCRLVFVGRPNAHLDSLKSLARSLGLEGDMLCLGYLPREDLTKVYQQALAFVHPETYDGFSMPVLEAMASGAPVLTSDAAALPEIVGDAAIQAPPDDTEAIARALRDLLLQPGLRAALRVKSLARARLFTWRRTAEQTLRVYDSLAGPAGEGS